MGAPRAWPPIELPELELEETRRGFERIKARQQRLERCIPSLPSRQPREDVRTLSGLPGVNASL
jgi:hypothetical protein